MNLTQHQNISGEAVEGRPRPVLFLHIPKTAGTSFIVMLQNAFGDNRVQRIRYLNDCTRPMIKDLLQKELDSISCLTGHLPIHMFDGSLDRFQPFTVLRHRNGCRNWPSGLTSSRSSPPSSRNLKP